MRNTQEHILKFWFEDTPPQQWFQVNPEFDAQIREEFGDAYEQAKTGQLSDWGKDASGSLALILLLDQFPRNMFRGMAQAFATDRQALLVSKQAISKGFDQILSPVKRRFLYMPFMHSENFQDQKKSLQLFGALVHSDPVGYKHAERHYKEIERFGRFPYRNAALGRDMEPEEQAYLEEMAAQG